MPAEGAGNGNKINDNFLRLVRSRVVPHLGEINDLISGGGEKVPLRSKRNFQRSPHQSSGSGQQSLVCFPPIGLAVISPDGLT